MICKSKKPNLQHFANDMQKIMNFMQNHLKLSDCDNFNLRDLDGYNAGLSKFLYFKKSLHILKWNRKKPLKY